MGHGAHRIRGLVFRRLIEQAVVAGALAAGRPPGAMSHIGKIRNRPFLILPMCTTPPGCPPTSAIEPSARFLLEPLGDPDLDDGLSRDPQTPRLAVE